MSKPSHKLAVSGGRASSSNTTIRNGVLGVGAIFVSTLIAGEWGLAASIVAIAILRGYYDSGKRQRRLDSTVRRYGE